MMKKKKNKKTTLQQRMKSGEPSELQIVKEKDNK